MSVLYGDPSKVAVQKVASGALLQIQVGGVEIGFGQSVDGRRQFGTEGAYGIGSIMPQEHVQQRYEGTVAVDAFYLRMKTLKELGLAALGVGILTMNVLDLIVNDKYSGVTPTPKVLRAYRNCTCSDYSESFRANAIAGENATWMYLSADNGTPESDQLQYPAI